MGRGNLQVCYRSSVTVIILKNTFFCVYNLFVCLFLGSHTIFCSSVSPYIPRTADCKLDPHVYEMVLYEYLKMDSQVSIPFLCVRLRLYRHFSQGFLNLVKEWSPELYNTSAVINAVLEHLLICDNDKDIYVESLAMLYSYERKYDKSLSMYLK